LLDSSDQQFSIKNRNRAGASNEASTLPLIRWRMVYDNRITWSREPQLLNHSAYCLMTAASRLAERHAAYPTDKPQ